MTAQELYDRRDERGEIDGEDLAYVFQDILGDPSPSGKTAIDPEALRRWADESRAYGAAHGSKVHPAADFIDALLR